MLDLNQMGSVEQNELRLETQLMHQGVLKGAQVLTGDSPAIFPSTAYCMADLEALNAVNSEGGYSYNRTGNPNRDQLGQILNYLEAGEASLSFSSGMAAISTTLLANLKAGDQVLANAALYGETIDFMNHYLSQFGITAVYVDFTDLEAVESAVTATTRMLYTEVISNPLTTVVDIKALATIAHRHQALLVVDSTFTTPLVIQPLKLGADFVIHSLTKYFGGHSDVTAGAVIGSEKAMDRVYKYQHLLGCCLDPQSAWLLQRSARTLQLRFQTQQTNAKALAAFLSEHPKVKAVYHPSLSSHPQHQLATRQLQGYGAILSFAIKDDRNAINHWMRQLKLIQYLPSLGGYKSTLSHPVSSSHADVPEATRLAMGIHEGLLRLSVGLEHVEDLKADLTQALNQL